MPFVFLVPSTCWSRYSLQEFQSCPFAAFSPKPSLGRLPQCAAIPQSGHWNRESSVIYSSSHYIHSLFSVIWQELTPLLFAVDWKPVPVARAGYVLPVAFLALKQVPVALCRAWSSVQAVSAELEWLYLFVFSPASYLYEISWSHIMCEVVKCYPASIRCDFSPPPF